jgi:hypothetical protein
MVASIDTLDLAPTRVSAGGSLDDAAVAKRRALECATVPVPVSLIRTDLAAFQDDCLRRLLTRYSGADIIGGWTKGPESNGVRVVRGDVEGSAWHSLCTTATMPFSTDKALRVLTDDTLLLQFDDMTKSATVVEELSDETKIRVVSCKPVLFTSPRDFVTATTVRREPSGRILIATRSVDHPAGDREGYVRALSHISGYVLTPDAHDPNVCELSLIAHMDIGGNMPAKVIKYLGMSAPIKLVQKFRDVAIAARV